MGSSSVLRRGIVLELFFLLIITSVAALLRFYRLEMYPPGLHGDEGCIGLDALRVLKEGWIGPYVPSALGQPAGPAYMAALIFKLFGASHFTVRASVALLGVLSIPASYFLYRTLFNQRVAILGVIILTFSYYHIHLSRIAFLPMSLFFTEVLCLLFLFLGYKTKHIGYFILAGIFFGLSVYTYHTYPLFTLAVIALLVFKAIKRAPPLKEFVIQHASFFILAFITAMPLIIFALQEEGGYLYGHSGVWFFRDPSYAELATFPEKAKFLGARMVRSALVFLKGGEIDYVDALGATPLLDPLAELLFIGGVVVCLWKWKDERHFLILVGLGTALLAAPLTLGAATHTRRMISALPFAAAAAALLSDQVWAFVAGRLSKRVGYLFAALVVCCIGFYNIRYYFWDFARAPSTRWVFCADLVESIDYIKSLPSEDLYVYFFSDRWSYNYETRQFLLPQVPGEDRSRQFGTFSLEKADNHQNVVYLFLPPYERLLEQIKEKYPDGSYKASGENGSVFSAYFVRADRL